MKVMDVTGIGLPFRSGGRCCARGRCWRSCWSGSFDSFTHGVVGDLSVVRDERLGDHFVRHIERQFSVLDDLLKQIQDVFRIKLAGLLGEAGWQVDRAHKKGGADLNALTSDGAFTVAAAFSAHIDDDRTGFHF